MQKCEHVLAGHINMHLSHGFTRMTDGTSDPLLLVHSVVSIVWVTDVETVHYVLKSACLHSVLGFCFSSGNNDTLLCRSTSDFIELSKYQSHSTVRCSS